MRTFIEFHKESKKKGSMPKMTGSRNNVSGLCDEFGGNSVFELFKPSKKELKEMGYNALSIEYDTCFWASGDITNRRPYEYTELRETIVLFCAAIEGEL